MDRVAREKLRWKCRRGLLELDIVLQRFLEKMPLGEDDCREVHALLDLPDNDLWDIVIGRSENYPSHLKDAVAQLRAA